MTSASAAMTTEAQRARTDVVGYPPSYWADTVPAQAWEPDEGVLQGEHRVDVAVIGAGYTGLSFAYHLAGSGGGDVAVLEAERPGWGCSGRNGGLVRPTLGRIPYPGWAARWGTERAQRLFQEALSAVRLVRSLAESGDIDCQVQPYGVLKTAHAPRAVRSLETEARALRDTFGVDARMLGPEELRADYFHSSEAHGALRIADAFGLHPLRYALQLLRLARQCGARVYSKSPVVHWRKSGTEHVLHTPCGVMRARRVVIATNGYGSERICRPFRGTLLPVLSNIIVTRPLSESELERTGFRTTEAIYDTRRLLNYYRRLPDNRMLIGSRGPIHDTRASRAHHRQRLIGSLRGKFPQLLEMTVDYYWSGWVAIPYDFVPHVGRLASDNTVLFGVGYSGSGVAAATYAGKLLAQLILNEVGEHEVLGTMPPRYPLAPLRRVAQALLFAWYQWCDDHLV